ncbi:MAG: acetate kinase [Myxococcota bacterium]|nr:acetate kinase [Myxococcota bacterium]
MSRVLVINSGSSSLKYALIEPETGAVVSQGIAERLEGGGHAEALERVFAELGDDARISAIGHRVVHGGEAFSESVVIDDRTVQAIRECTALAPLHNPANLLGIEAARRAFPGLVQVAVFDTAFHQSLPRRAFLYAVPYELYEQHQLRRYGFHGTSHRYVAEEAASRLGRPLAELELVTAHLGNGCSATAVRGGKSIDTSMGLTPLEGLVMGTRSGNVDPALHQFLAERTGQSLAQITELLTRKSGLLGLSGRSNDMRTLLEAREQGDERAAIAVEVFCYRLAKTVLGLCAGLERLDALVFTGGIGEHAASVRQDTLKGLSILGFELDPERNLRHGKDSGGRITRDGSVRTALVVGTNEELVIAREALRLARDGGR